MEIKLFSVLLICTALLGCSKPASIRHSCTTNGHGKADCSFVNKGESDGTLCIKVLLSKQIDSNRTEYLLSEEICSGIIRAGDVVERSLGSAFPRKPADFCKSSTSGNDTSSWDKNCAMTIVSSDTEFVDLLKKSEAAESARLDKIATAQENKVFASKGAAIYEQTCKVCHSGGIAGSPKFGNKNDWQPRISKGVDVLTASAINGLGAMPPRGGGSYTDAEIKETVEFMLSAAK